MPTWASKELEGWGRFPVIRTQCTRPERREEAVEALEARGDGPVIPFGLGRSYGDAALLRQGRVILTRRLDCMLDFDPETGWLRCEAGVSIEDLVDTFLPRGFFPPVVPGTKFVTVGGALASDIHGKNHHVDGTFADHVRRVELLTGTGEIVTCDATQNSDLFWATVGGQGLTGLILAMDVQLTPVESPFIELETVRANNLDEFFEVSGESGAFTHLVSWIDNARTGHAMGRSVVMRGRHARANKTLDPDPIGTIASLLEPIADVGFLENNLLLNRATIQLFNEAWFRKTPAGTSSAVVDIDTFFFPLDVVRNWNKVYGSRGFLQYQFVVPSDPEQRAVRQILELFARRGFISFLSVIKEFGDNAHPWLSFPRPGVTVAMDIPHHGPELLEAMEQADDIVADAGGRIYLGKDARLGRAHFERMYPDHEEWKAVKEKWDPDDVFQSELGLRLGLCGGGR